MTQSKEYVVVVPGITHDGRRYPRGVKVELDADSAAYHVRYGAIRAVKAERGGESGTSTNSQISVRGQLKTPKGEKE